MPATVNDYDGFYFLPGEEDGDLNIAYFKFNSGEVYGLNPVKSSPIGYSYHIAFFREDEDGDPTFDDSFEAIFADPVVYIQQLVGSNLYGCILRKTEKSSIWWDDYLTQAKDSCIMHKSSKNMLADA